MTAAVVSWAQLWVSVESESPTPGFAGGKRGGSGCSIVKNRYFSTNFRVYAGVHSRVGGVAQHCYGCVLTSIWERSLKLKTPLCEISINVKNQPTILTIF